MLPEPQAGSRTRIVSSAESSVCVSRALIGWPARAARTVSGGAWSACASASSTSEVTSEAGV